MLKIAKMEMPSDAYILFFCHAQIPEINFNSHMYSSFVSCPPYLDEGHLSREVCIRDARGGIHGKHDVRLLRLTVCR